MPVPRRVDVKQSARVYGHRRALHHQQRTTWYVFIHLSTGYHVNIRTEELLIDFRELIGEHSGENMAEAVWATLEMYGLVGKVSP